MKQKSATLHLHLAADSTVLLTVSCRMTLSAEIASKLYTTVRAASNGRNSLHDML